MVFFRTLEDTDHDTLHKAFMEGFSDYQVKMDLPSWKFERMLLRRGFDPHISIGAFDGESLVGFVFNGLRRWKGKLTAYDQGTAVVPEYRRRGITSDMLSQLKPLLKDRQVEQYLLEVLTVNESAFALYKKQGFEVQREFTCCRLPLDQLKKNTAYPVTRVEKIDFDSVRTFWDFEPSWQNSVDSICSVPDAFAYFQACEGTDVIGYGVIEIASGDIPQLAVSPQHRGRGIAGSLLAAMANSAQAAALNVLNVQTGIHSAEGFLFGAGFVPTVGQYEMLMSL